MVFTKPNRIAEKSVLLLLSWSNEGETPNDFVVDDDDDDIKIRGVQTFMWETSVI